MMKERQFSLNRSPELAAMSLDVGIVFGAEVSSQKALFGVNAWDERHQQ